MLAGSRRLKGERAKVEVDHRPVIKKQQHNSIHTDPSCHSIVVQNDIAPQRYTDRGEGKKALVLALALALALARVEINVRLELSYSASIDYTSRTSTKMLFCTSASRKYI